MTHELTNAERLSVFAHRFARGEITAEQLWSLGTQDLAQVLHAKSLKLQAALNDKDELSSRVRAQARQIAEQDLRHQAMWRGYRRAEERIKAQEEEIKDLQRPGAARLIQAHFRGHIARKEQATPTVSYCGSKKLYSRHPLGTFWSYPRNRKLPNKGHDTYDPYSFCNNCVCVQHNPVTTQWRCQGHEM
jgi:hypothetical protein